MWLCSGSQHSHERSRGISILMCIHLGRGASHYTCCASQRPRSKARAQLPQPASILLLSQTAEQKLRLSLCLTTITRAKKEMLSSPVLPLSCSPVPFRVVYYLGSPPSTICDKKELHWVICFQNSRF